MQTAEQGTMNPSQNCLPDMADSSHTAHAPSSLQDTPHDTLVNLALQHPVAGSENTPTCKPSLSAGS